MNKKWLIKFFGVVIMLALLLHHVGVMPAQAQTQTVTLIAEADASTQQGMPNNYGSDPTLMNNGGYGCVLVRKSSTWGYHGYFRFDLAGIPANTITSATLRLYSSRGYANTVVLYSVTNDAWTEAGITWNNAPSGVTQLGSYSLATGFNDFSVTSFVSSQTDGKVSFRVEVQNELYTGAPIISREGRTDWRPQLVITHTSGVVVPPEPAPTSTSLLPFNTIWRVHDGTWTQYATAQDAINAAQPGDEVVFGPGRYYERMNISNSGTAANPIVIRGDGYPKPILDSSGLTSFTCFGSARSAICVHANYITFENLEIKDSSNMCGFETNASSIYVNTAANTVVRNMYLHHNGNGIFVTKNATNFLEEFSEIAWNSYVGGGYEHGHYISGGGTTTIRYNHIHHNGGQGYKDRSQNLVLAYNYIHDSGNYEVDIVSGEDYWSSPQNALVIGNIVKSASSSTNRGKVILFGEDRLGGVGRFINNTIITDEASSKAFFQLWDRDSTGADRIELYNNILYANGFTNVSVVMTGTNASRVTGSYNWIQTDAQNRGNITNSIVGTTPGFEGAASGNYHLAFGSQCIDAGTSSISPLPDYQYAGITVAEPRMVAGNGIDLGAFEFGNLALSLQFFIMLIMK